MNITRETENNITRLIVNYGFNIWGLAEAETTEDFAYARGYIAAAESWMKALGISPESDTVKNIINHCK